MNDTAYAASVPPSSAPMKPPRAMTGPIAWMRDNLFNSPLNIVLTVLMVAAMGYFGWKLLHWAVFDAVVEANVQRCRAAEGACWGFVNEKWRLIIFGTYPFAEQWRPAVMMVMLITLVVVTLMPSMWSRWLGLAWIIGLIAMYVLMAGGVLGLTPVPTLQWGGLPLTLILSVTGIVFSFPIAVLLALGRQSRLPAIKAISVAFIELVRGVPLISILFMASLLLPIFLPQEVRIDQLVRAQVAFTLFAAAYVAEVIRGGLQAVPKGQYEAADALGLGYWQKMGLIVLPQALKVVIAPMVNTFIGLFKDTSLVVIVSMFDLLGTTRAASNDPDWRQFYVEGLVFIAVIYFVFCYSMARYSQWVEARLNTGHR